MAGPPMLRVVAGELRGRKLAVPRSGSTRPTTDRVREAVFNALGSLDVVVGARVVDLYAGSGAMGIEALSRGAAHCTFVERDRAAVHTINANVEALGLGDRSRVVAGDALAVAGRFDADVAFADPPYDAGDWHRLLAVVDAPLLVAEAGAAIEPHPPDHSPAGESGEQWSVLRAKRYGRTWVTFLQRRGNYRGDSS